MTTTYRFAYEWKGAWASGTRYAKDDLVKYAGSVYKAKIASTGQTPGENTYWTVFVSKGDNGLGNTLATFYNCKDYDCEVDGATDDSSALNTLINTVYAAGGGVIFIPAGTMKLNSQVVLKDGVTLLGVGRATHLDFSGAGAITTCIASSGGALTATSVAFSSNITAGDRTITFPSAPDGVAAGTILVIYDSADSSFSAARTYYRKGEMVRVQGVSGGTVTLESPVYGSYTSGGTVSIYKMTTVTVGVSNLRATFKTGLTGIKITQGHRCNFDNLELAGSNVSQLTLHNNFEAIISRVRVYDVTAAGSNNYGVGLSNSQRVIVQGCHLSTTRHGLTVGGDDIAGAIPNRELLIEGNLIATTGTTTEAADAHGNCSHVTFNGNQIIGGISIGGDYITITGNHILGTSGASIGSTGIYASEVKGLNWLIQDNHIVSTRDSASVSSSGLIYLAGQYVDTNGTLRIRGNRLDMKGYTGYGVKLVNVTASGYSDRDSTVEVTENTITGTSTATLDTFGIFIQGDGVIGWRRVIVNGNVMNGTCIRLEKTASTLIEISRNTLHSCNLNAIEINPYTTAYTASQVSQQIIARGNIVHMPRRAGIVLQGDFDGSVTTITCEGNQSTNTCQGAATGNTNTDSSFYLNAARLAVFRNNVVGKDSTSGSANQTRAYAFNTITDLIEEGNVNVGTTTTVNRTTITNQYYDDAIRVSFQGVPGASATETWIATRKMYIPANAPGSYAKAAVAATASTTFTIYQNGVSKGTFNFAIGAATATFTWGSNITIAPGDRISIVGPNPADATLADIGLALQAYRY